MFYSVVLRGSQRDAGSFILTSRHAELICSPHWRTGGRHGMRTLAKKSERIEGVSARIFPVKRESRKRLPLFSRRNTNAPSQMQEPHVPCAALLLVEQSGARPHWIVSCQSSDPDRNEKGNQRGSCPPRLFTTGDCAACEPLLYSTVTKIIQWERKNARNKTCP